MVRTRLSRYLLESYPVGLTRGELSQAGQRAADLAAQMRAGGVDIWLVQSTWAPAEDSLFCIFDAPSPGIVEEVVRRSGLPLDRLIEVIDVGPDGRSHGE